MRYILFILISFFSMSSFAGQDSCRDTVDNVLNFEFGKSNVSSFTVQNIPNICVELLNKDIQLINKKMNEKPQFKFLHTDFFAVCDGFCSNPDRASLEIHRLSNIKKISPLQSTKNDLFYYVVMTLFSGQQIQIFVSDEDQHSDFIYRFLDK